MSIQKLLISCALIIFTVAILPSDAHAISSYECQRTIVFTEAGATDQGMIDKSTLPTCASISADSFGFAIPTLGDLMTFGIRIFFAIAGVVALFQMLIGALSWIISGGEKDKVTAARDRIQAAIVGMILLVVVLSLVWTMEQVLFKRRICLGLTCPLIIPGLIETSTQTYPDPWGNPVMQTQDAKCCVCPDANGNPREAVNLHTFTCNPDGTGSPL